MVELVYQFVERLAKLKYLKQQGSEKVGEETLHISKLDVQMDAHHAKDYLMHHPGDIVKELEKMQFKVWSRVYQDTRDFFEYGKYQSLTEDMTRSMLYSRILAETLNRVIELEKKGELNDYLQQHINKLSRWLW